MRRNRSNFQAERTEINVSPLIDMVFILLIFFIVATSFIDEIGISSNYKDSNSMVKNENKPLFFTLPGSGEVLVDGYSVGLEGVASKVRNSSGLVPPPIVIQVSEGAKAGLATQVMDQALLAGAKAVKMAAISK
jgi:biopolymer transport protein ExbD